MRLLWRGRTRPSPSFCVALLLAGCRCDAPTPPHERPESPPVAAPEPPPVARLATSSARPTVDAGWAPDTSRLAIAPRPVPEQRIALSARRLAWASDEAVSIYSLPDMVRVAAEPRPSGGSAMPSKVMALIGGSFLVLSPDAVLRISRGSSEFRRFPRASQLGLSWVYPDRSDVARWWALSWRGATLLRYDVSRPSSTQLLPESEVTLDRFDHRVFGSLRDGSIVHSSPDGLVRRWPGGRTSPWATEAEARGAWRVLPGRGVGDAWVVFRDGRMQRRSLAHWGSPIVEVSLQGTPYSVDACSRGLAVVVVRGEPIGERSWFVELWSQEGQRSFEASLRAESAGTGDWFARATADRDVAASARWPRIAVGGARRLTVFDTTSGAVVYDSASEAGSVAPD